MAQIRQRWPDTKILVRGDSGGREANCIQVPEIKVRLLLVHV